MAQSYCLNLEISSSKAAEEEIRQMTDSNVAPLQNNEHNNLYALDDQAFSNNLYHGYNALVHMHTYMEACLNTIYRVRNERKAGNGSSWPYVISRKEMDSILRLDQPKKIDHFKKEWLHNEWHSIENYWQCFRDLMHNARNPLVHYNYNWVANETLPDPRGWFITLAPGESAQNKPQPAYAAGTLFTQKEMTGHWENEQKLVRLLVEKSGLLIMPFVDLIQPAAKDPYSSYLARKDRFLSDYPTREKWLDSYGEQRGSVESIPWEIDPWN